MTDEEINIAIAKIVEATIDDDKVFIVINGDICGFGLFTEDLNAMHEAEKIIAQDTADTDEYAFNLTSVAAPSAKYGEYSRHEIFKISHVTARQRAEAFLKTLNLWTK